MMNWDEFERGWAANTPEQTREFAFIKWGLYIDAANKGDRDFAANVLHRMRWWLRTNRPELEFILDEEHKNAYVRQKNKAKGWLFPYTTAPQAQMAK